MKLRTGYKPGPNAAAMVYLQAGDEPSDADELMAIFPEPRHADWVVATINAAISLEDAVRQLLRSGV